MVTGVVYKYTDPDGIIYVGQTTNECARRGQFFLSKQYSGYKFDKARHEIGPENFTYERLVRNTYADEESAKADLDKLERYYIDLFDSINNGYNSKKGNGVGTMYIPKSRQYKNCAAPSVKYPKQREGVRRFFKPVVQYSVDGRLIATYESIGDASRATNIHISNITRCCQGKIKRTRNFIFKFL